MIGFDINALWYFVHNEVSRKVISGAVDKFKKQEAEIAAKDAEIAAKDVEIESLRLLLSDCLDCFEHTPTRPIAVAVRKALEARG